MQIKYYISDHLNEIKLGGSKVLLRKTKKLLITLICFPNYVFITPFVLITRILRPFICIRFGPIRNDVIGHFAFDTESYLTETIINKTDTLDLFYLLGPKSPNSQWELMVKRHFKHNSIFKYFDRINRIIPGWKNHFVKLNNTGSRDTNNFSKKILCHISF